MLKILLRNICKRGINIFMLILINPIVLLHRGSIGGIKIFMLILICLLSGGIYLPHEMFILPLSREDRKEYVRALRRAVFALSGLVCVSTTVLMMVFKQITITDGLCICITIMCTLYVLSYSDYFRAKDSAMMGVLVFFCLINILLLGCADFYGNAGVITERMWVPAGVILAAVIEITVFRRYTNDMIHMLSDYEASVNMEKKV